MSFTPLDSGSTRLLQLLPRCRLSSDPNAFRLSTREIVSPLTLRRDPTADFPTNLVKPDGPSEPLIIRAGAPTPVLVLLSSAPVPGSTNELHSSRREIGQRLPPSILVLGLCLAFPPPSPNRRSCLLSPGLQAMVRRPMDTPDPPRLHPSRTRRDLGRRNRFQPFLLSSRRVPTVCFVSQFF